MTPDRIEAKLMARGFSLPEPLRMPASNRRPWFLAGRMLYLSGHGSALLDDAVGPKRIGKVPTEVSVADAQAVSEALALKMLATIRAALGRLDRVTQVVKLTGFVNSAPDFEAPNTVINGASDLFHDLYGPEAGCHCRSAIGAGALVARQSVEIEGIFMVAARD
ncbi:MAG: RidA family protein [Rhodobacteraceae bacterium]|nr:RidA family protein [Paracoccaceae bacterium]